MSEVKRALPGLNPTSRYVVRVRATSKFGIHSDWSEAIDFSTPGDSSIPNPPTDLTGDFATPSLALSWTAPTHNTDGTVFRDFSHYTVTLTTADEESYTYRTVAPFFLYDRSQNLADNGGQAEGAFTVEVRAFDITDKASEPATLSVSNPAPNKPNDLSGFAVLRTVTLYFTPDVTDHDVVNYLLERSTSPDEGFVEIASVPGDSYIDLVPEEGTTYYYRYRVQDVFYQASPYSNTFSIDSEEQWRIDTDPPGQVQDFQVSENAVDQITHRAYLEFQWTPNNADDDLSFYELRLLKTGGGGFAQGYQISPYSSSYRATDLDPDVEYQAVLYAYDYFGNRSASTPTITVTTAADDSTPDTPENYMATGGLELVFVSWDPVDHPQLSHYEVYSSRTSGFTPDTVGYANRVFVGNSSRHTEETTDQETVYFRLRAVNSNGQASAFTPEFSGTSRVGYVRDTEAPGVPALISPLETSLDPDETSAAYVDLSWVLDPSPDDLAGFKVQYRRYDDETTPLETKYTSVDVSGSSFDTRVRGLIPGVWYGFRIQAYDDSLNYSGFSPEVVVQTAVNTVPPDVPTFAGTPEVYVNLRSIWWVWNAADPSQEQNRDLKHYEAEISTSSDFASVEYTYRGLDASVIYQTDQPDTVYYLRVRAVNNSGFSSAWSETVSARTVKVELTDDAPSTPTNLATTTGIDSSGATDTSFINATWDEVVSSILAGYTVRIRRGAEGSYDYINVPADQTSVKISGLIPNTEYHVQIASYSRVGYQSTYTAEHTVTTAVDGDAPGTPTNLSSYATLRSLFFGWDPVIAPDLSHYQAQVSGNPGFTGTPFVFEGLATGVSYVAPELGDFYFRVRAVDVSGNASSWSSVIQETASEIEGLDIDTDPPAVPTGLALASGVELQGKVETFFLTADWNANTDNDLAGYIVRLRRDGESNYEYRNLPKPDSSARFSGLLAGTTYQVSVLAYDQFGNHSAYTSEVDHTIAGDATPPPVPQNPQGRGSLRSLIWEWDTVEAADLDRYEAQVDTSTSFSSPDHVFEGLATGFTYIAPSLGEYYMRVRAVDVSGNKSAWSSTASANAVEIEGVDLDTDPPAVPTGLAVSSGQEFNAQVENLYINATWDANSEDDLAGYTVRLRRGTESRYEYRDVPMGDTSVKFVGLQGNTEYRVQVLAYDQLGNHSTYTAEEVIVTSRDSVAPSNVANLTLTSGIRSIIAQWDGVTAEDLKHYNVDVAVDSGGSPGTFYIFSKVVATAEQINKYYNGSAWVDLVPESTYHVRVRPEDVSGNIPSSPPSSSAVVGQTRGTDIGDATIGNAKISDLAVDKVTAGTLSAVVTVSGTIRTATSGARLVIDSAGLTGYATNGVTENLRYNNTTGDVTIVGNITAGSSSSITGGTVTGGIIRTNTTPTTNGIQIDDTDGFRAFQSGVLNAHITRLGHATFKRASLTGASGDVTLSVGSGNSIFKVDSSGLYLGHTTFSSAPFRVTYAGAVTANSITLGGGTINGAFNLTGASAKLRIGTTTDTGARIAIDQNSLKAFNAGGTETFSIDRATGNVTMTGTAATVAITSGTITGGTIQTNPTPTTNGIIINDADGFRAFEAGTLNAHVTRLGHATLKKATIAGAIGEVVLTVGSATSIFQVDGSGVAVGNSTFSSAPFRVTYGGSVTATDITLGGGQINGPLNLVGSNAKLRIGSSTDTGARIAITQDWLKSFGTSSTNDTTDVKFLVDADTGNVTMTDGVLTSGTITGATVQTSSNPQTSGGVVLSTAAGLEGYEGSTRNTQISTTGVASFRKVSIAGTAADAGSGGVTMSVTSGVNSMRVDTSGLYLGPIASAFAAAPFSVSYDGSVKASKLTIFGSSSEIQNGGSLTLNGDIRLLTTTGRLYLGATSGARVEASSTGIRAYDGSGETFNLNADGSITLTGPVISGGSITGASIDIGAGTSSFHVNSTGDLWLGSETYAGAPFQVYRDGSALATKMRLTGAGFASDTDRVIDTSNFWVTKAGAITAQSGSIGGVTIESTKLTGGTLEGSTIQGATFKIDNAGSIQFTGSGEVTWQSGATGGIIVSNSGYIRSGNFSSGSSAGWSLGPSGLEIYEGTIRGAALQIGVSSTNLLRNASFEDYVDAAFPNWTLTSGTTATQNVTSLYQSHSLELGRTGTGVAEVNQTITFPEAVPVGTDVTMSAWMRKSSGTSRDFSMKLTDASGSTVYGTSGTTTVSSTSSWVRLTFTFRTTASFSTAVFRVVSASGMTSGDVFFLDGAQVQLSSYPTDFAPAPLDIPTNYINSTHIASLSADRIIGGTIGAEIIELEDSPNSIIQSAGYAAGSGWQIKGDGTATFNNGSVTILGAGGNLTLDSSSMRLTTGSGTAFHVNSTGAYFGGSSSSTASLYNEGTKTVFQSSGAGHKLLIDTSAPASLGYDGVTSVSKIMSLHSGATPGATDKFYLTASGDAYFSGAVMTGVRSYDPDIRAGRMTIAPPGTTTQAPSGSLLVASGGDIYVNGGGIKLGDTNAARDNAIEVAIPGHPGLLFGKGVLSYATPWDGLTFDAWLGNNIWVRNSSTGEIVFRVGSKLGGSGYYLEYNGASGSVEIKTEEFSVIGGNATFSGTVSSASITSSSIVGSTITTPTEDSTYVEIGVVNDYSQANGITWNGSGRPWAIVGTVDGDLVFQKETLARTVPPQWLSPLVLDNSQMLASAITSGSSPSISFQGYQDRGFLRTSTGVGVSVGGATRFVFDSTLFRPSSGQTPSLGNSTYPWHDLHLDVAGYIYFGSTYYLWCDTNDNWRLNMKAGAALYPLTNNSYRLGSSSNKWAEIWQTAGPVTGSDIRTKSNIREIELGLDFIQLVKPSSYTLLDGARTHAGFIAQGVKEALDALGVDFAGLIIPHIGEDDADEDTPWGLRYEEFIPIAFRGIQQQQEMIEDLQAEVENLKVIISEVAPSGQLKKNDPDL